jgi:hypothetical protein
MSINASSFGEDEAGELYLVDRDGGGLYRLLFSRVGFLQDRVPTQHSDAVGSPSPALGSGADKKSVRRTRSIAS